MFKCREVLVVVDFISRNMVVEKVWLRFEKIKKDGSTWKLRIQDMPPERLGEVIDLKVQYFARDEVVHKAIGITKNPQAVKEYTGYSHATMSDPACRTVICCEDNDDEVGDILGISSVSVGKEAIDWDGLMETMKEKSSESAPEGIKLTNVFYEIHKIYNPIKELNVSSYLDDMSVLVLPDYRGYGIAQQFLRTRRLMCAEFNIPKTGGWMTGFGTQVAAARDEWETVFELKYEDLAKAHDLVFENAPPTMKYCVADPVQES